MEETFYSELGMHLSYVYDRAKANNKYISKILDAKNQILNGQGVFIDDIQMINRILDDAIKLQQICEIHKKDFGKFVYTHTDMNYLLEDDTLERAEKTLAEAKKHLKSQ